MRFTLRQLQIFIAIGRTGSTTAAAENISLSQSAVSAALHELETCLDTRLFDRVGNRLVLNDNGRMLMPQASLIVDGAETMEREFSSRGGPAASLLKVGTSATIGHYIMPALVAGFREQEPATHVAVRISDINEIANAVTNFDVDVGFIEGPCHEPELKTITWMLDKLVIVSSSNHPVTRRYPNQKIPIEELQKADWLLRERGSGTREVVEEMLLPHLHYLNEGTVFGSAEALKRGAVHGLGLSCLSHWAIQDQLACGRLAVLDTPLPELTRQFYIIYHKKKYLSARLQLFIHHCQVSELSLV